jgi:hypothetical protein
MRRRSSKVEPVASWRRATSSGSDQDCERRMMRVLPISSAVTEIFFVNDGVFAARRLRIYIRSIYNKLVTNILVRIQLG